MLTNIETLSALERRVTFAVPAADIEREVEKRLQQMSRTVRVSGFRPGKVPLKMMNQQMARRCVRKSPVTRCSAPSPRW